MFYALPKAINILLLRSKAQTTRYKIPFVFYLVFCIWFLYLLRRSNMFIASKHYINMALRRSAMWKVVECYKHLAPPEQSTKHQDRVNPVKLEA
jgi:hypothetical protein